MSKLEQVIEAVHALAPEDQRVIGQMFAPHTPTTRRAEAVRHARGSMKGRLSSIEDFLQSKREDVELEDRKLAGDRR